MSRGSWSSGFVVLLLVSACLGDVTGGLDSGELLTDAGHDAGEPDGGSTDSGLHRPDAGNLTDGGLDPYSTAFPVAENPLRESGRWVVGKTDGRDWNDPKTVAGHAVASVLSGNPNRYNDSIAHLAAAFAPNQFAQGTVYRQPGYDPAPSKHEVELLLRFDITMGTARGYEILWGISGYLAVVRWNGPLGDYTPLLDTGDPGIGPPIDGDLLRAEVVGNSVTVWKNGTQVASVNLGSAGGVIWADGHPGLGLWPVDQANPEGLGWKHWLGASR
jgi:hypothetical protein